MKIGIFGGSFNPIHLGHLLVAEAARDTLGLERVTFIPTFISPLKHSALPVDPKHRVEMIRLAIGGNSSFQVDTREIDRGGISYTIDTLESLQISDEGEVRGDRYVLIIGADSLNDFARWKSPERILKRIELAVVSRGGGSNADWNILKRYIDDSAIVRHQQNTLVMPQIEISSSDIRSRTQQKRSIRYQVPSSVEMYIEHHSLYR